MSKIVKMQNGNIVCVVAEEYYKTITLYFSIKNLILGDRVIGPDNNYDDMDISVALHHYINGEKGVDSDTAIENVMNVLTHKANDWINTNGLKGVVLEHTLIRPNEWIDLFMIHSTVKFYLEDFSNRNYAKVKNLKLYDEILKGNGPSMYTIEIDMTLPVE